MGTKQQAVNIPVEITVLKGNNVSNKNEPLVHFVRVEFNGTVLGDSERLDVVLDQNVNYNFTCSFVCSDSTHTLDDLAHKPVISDKKLKVEKSSILGQAVVDLLPLLYGQSIFTSSVELHFVAGNDTVSQDRTVKPTLDVAVSVPNPLLSDTQLSISNLLTVTVETAFSVPEVWNPASGPPCSYTAALQIPVSAKKEQILWFPNGVIKMGGEREPVPRPKKWPLSSLLVPDAQFIPGTSIEGGPIDLEDGDLNAIEDRQFRDEAEYKSNRVSWDTERRCFLDAGGLASLTHRIAECRLWPLEIMRSPQTEAAKTTTGKAVNNKQTVEDNIQISFHSIAYVDLGPLLYPGARCIRGAYKLHPFSYSDLQNKTTRNTSILQTSMKTMAAQGLPHSPDSRKDTRDASKKTGLQGKSNPPENMTDDEQPVNAEGQMYVDSRSYIVIEITLEKPLVPKRPPEEVTKRVKQLIPTRPPLTQQPTRAERAVQEYHTQIASVTAQMLEQYQQMFGAVFISGSTSLDSATREQYKAQFLGELNCSGKYFIFKEQMKNSVVRIVRENFMRNEPFTDPEELRSFLSQLYVFLVDEMHVALNKNTARLKAITSQDKWPTTGLPKLDNDLDSKGNATALSREAPEYQAQPLMDWHQLTHFAKEAQLIGDYQLAAQYYQEQLAQDQHSQSFWFDYGVFYMLTEEFIKAEECFLHALSFDQTHVSSLLMCGILSDLNRRYDDAESFFERASCIKPSCVVAWTLLGLFYQAKNNLIQAEYTFKEANKQLRTDLISSLVFRGDSNPTLPEGEEEEVGVSKCLTDSESKFVAEGGSEIETRPQSYQMTEIDEGCTVNTVPEPAELQQQGSSVRLGTTIYMETVKFLLQNHAVHMAQRALAQELLCAEGRPGSSYHLALGHVQLLRGDYSSAKVNLQESLRHDYQNPNAWALYGHLCFLMKDYEQAKKCYERTLDFNTDCSDPHPVYLRLGSIYLQAGQYDKAKQTYFRACKSSSSCLTWLGLGIACYRLGELTEAEDALTEANILNIKNPEVWGYLSLVCLQNGRKLEAEQSYKCALKFNLKDETLLQEIRELQAVVGFGNLSFGQS